MEGEQASYQAVLPTSQKRSGLISNEANPQAQFLVGYRNILTSKGESLQWGLVKSKVHCGRAFVYSIEQSKALAIHQFKTEDEIIETVGNSYIFLKIEKDIVKPTVKIPQESVKKLLEELGGVNKINLNILKNAFDTYQEYRNAIDIEIQKALGVQEGFKELQLKEKVQIEYKSKLLSGNALKQLPYISKDTGKWDEQKMIELKILEH